MRFGARRDAGSVDAGRKLDFMRSFGSRAHARGNATRHLLQAVTASPCSDTELIQLEQTREGLATDPARVLVCSRVAVCQTIGYPRAISVRQIIPVVFGVALAGVFCPRFAQAAAQDAEAQELADQAIFTDYLQLDFKAAEKKLRDAIALCEKGSCSPTVHAQVYRDLAVIYITGLKRPDEGRKLLVKALRLDPRVALDADLTTPDLIRVFEQAQQDVANEPEAEEPAPPAKAAPAERKSDPKTSPEPEDDVAEEAPPPTGSLDDDASADCPPDFPGCEAIPDKTEDEDDDSADVDLGTVNWLSAGLQQDFLMFSGEAGVCGTERPEELSCFRAGDEFRDPTVEFTAGDGGEVGGGFRPATTRLLIGYDRVLFPNITVGARLGYAIGGGPTQPNGASFVPFHAEVRGAYWFAPIEIGKVRPYATLGGGLAQIDSSVTTELVDRGPQGQIPLDSTGQPQASRVTVWKKTGTTFASIGGGAMYPLTEKSGITAELKGVLLFPSAGMSVSLQAGYSHGF